MTIFKDRDKDPISPIDLLHKIQRKLEAPFMLPGERRKLCADIDRCLADLAPFEGRQCSYLKNFSVLTQLRTGMAMESYEGKITRYRGERFFFEGSFISIAYAFLVIAEESVGNRLWLSQFSPFNNSIYYGLRMAQSEFSAPVLSKYLPCEKYLEEIKNRNMDRLVVAELPDEASEDSLQFFLKVLKALPEAKYNTILLALDKGFPVTDKTFISEACGSLVKTILSGKEVYLGCKKFSVGTAENDFISALRGVLR